MHVYLTMIWVHLIWLLQAAGQHVDPVIPKHASASPLGTQITISTLVVYLLEWLKTKKWAPFVQKNAATMNKITAGVVAFIAALGVSYTWDATNHQLVIANVPTLAGFVTVLWIWVKQWVMQELVYKGIVQQPSAPVPNPVP